MEDVSQLLWTFSLSPSGDRKGISLTQGRYIDRVIETLPEFNKYSSQQYNIYSSPVQFICVISSKDTTETYFIFSLNDVTPDPKKIKLSIFIAFMWKKSFCSNRNTKSEYIKKKYKRKIISMHRIFSLSLSNKLPVEQPSPQSNCWPAGGGVKCVWSFAIDSLITYKVFWNKIWNVHGPRNKTWCHVNSGMILGSPDDSLKVCGNEKDNLGPPGISGK